MQGQDQPPGMVQMPMIATVPMPLSIMTGNEQVMIPENGVPTLKLMVKQMVSGPFGMVVLYYDADFAIDTAKALMKYARQAQLNGFQLPQGFVEEDKFELPEGMSLIDPPTEDADEGREGPGGD